MKKYTVLIKKKCTKAIAKLSEKDRYTLAKLIDSIEDRGPVQPSFMNELSETKQYGVSLPSKLSLGSLLAM